MEARSQFTFYDSFYRALSRIKKSRTGQMLMTSFADMLCMAKRLILNACRILLQWHLRRVFLLWTSTEDNLLKEGVVLNINNGVNPFLNETTILVRSVVRKA